MTNFILKGYQKPLHRKRYKYTRDELQLELYRQTYELMKNYKQTYINSALRKIRLSNLFEYIKEKRNRNITKKREFLCAKPKVKIKSDIELKREQWLEARQIGNNFSKMNKFNKIDPRQQCRPKKDIVIDDKEKKMQKAKDFGNIWSLLNVIKIHLPQKNPRGLSQSEELLKKRRCTFEYGTYYSLRNKLSLKETQGEFDSEYQNLLEKCVEFEKDHLNVSGFLEEKLYSSFNSQLNAKYKNSKTQTPRKKDVFIKKVTVGVQVNMDKESPPSKKEEPPTKSRLHNSDDHVTNVCLKPKNIESTSTLSSSSNNPQNYESTSNSNESSEKFISFSDAMAIGQYFEDAVLNITKNCGPEDTESNKMKLIISDLFLTFGMKLVKSTLRGIPS